MHTVAMVAKDTAIDFMCWPDFDSPSVFCRLLDKDKGGHFTIKPKNLAIANSKQNYLPSSNILQTRFLGEEGVLDVIDFFPIPADKPIARPASAVRAESQHDGRPRQDDPQRWVVRRVECIRGTVDVELEVLPVRTKHPRALIEQDWLMWQGFQLCTRQTHHNYQRFSSSKQGRGRDCA